MMAAEFDPEEEGGIALEVEPLALAAAGIVGGMLAGVALLGAAWVLVARQTRRMELRPEPNYFGTGR